jgi:hypothetical protein
VSCWDEADQDGQSGEDIEKSHDVNPCVKVNG